MQRFSAVALTSSLGAVFADEPRDEPGPRRSARKIRHDRTCSIHQIRGVQPVRFPSVTNSFPGPPCFLRKDNLMIQPTRRLRSIGSMFQRRNPRQRATLALARLLSQIDMASLPFDRGVEKSRRQDDTRHVAIGVWLVPLAANQHPGDARLDKAVPAATCDLRRHGIGVLMPTELKTNAVMMAVADQENVWRFFIGTVRHQTGRPGGWFHIGMTIDEAWDPSGVQASEFRHHVENAFAAEPGVSTSVSQASAANI